MQRRKFLRGGLLGLGGLVASRGLKGQTPNDDFNAILQDRVAQADLQGSVFDLATDGIPKVRIALIGLGNRGSSLIDMLEWLIGEGHAEITAISDINPEKIDKAQARIGQFQKNAPQVFTGSDGAWKTACNTEIADMALICTPWEWHAPMAIHAMRQGLHAASEVPIATTYQETIDLVQTAEETRRHCIMLENCCYNGEELWIMQMIKEGVFGTLTHAECAYLHDLRVMMLDPTYYEDRWRLKHHLHRNGNLYTTHGLGPVSMYFDILRGDTLSHLVSMSSKEAALSEALAATDEGALQDMAQRVKCGDVNTTLIGTASGKSIMLQFDTHSGRPYSRLDKVVGSKAAHYGYPSRLYVDHGPSWGHSWLDEAETAEMRDRYAHPLWTKLQALAADHKQGHGGMDFVMMFRLIRCLNQGLPLDMNVYDGALWSLTGILGEESVSRGTFRVNIPDLTGGKWRNTAPHPVHRDIA